MGADVASRHRAQHSIHDGVEHNVAVGMTDHALLVRHRHAAQHEMIAGAEAMDIEAHADAGLQGDSRRDGALALRRQDALGARKILLGGDLEIVLVAGRERNGQPGMLRHRGIVGQRTASRGAVGVENCADSGSLGGSERARGPRAAPCRRSRHCRAPPA